MKHIESIQPEYAADDMTALLLSDATASAALSSLLLDWTGCAIPPTATIPESEVEELVPLCLSILRRHWTTPLTALGDGTTPMSLADLMRRLIGDRVQGNEAWSIPAIHANIPTAVSALRQRDMSSGLTLTLTDGGADGSTPTITSLPDGLSLAQLLCGNIANNVTEITDTNHGWEIAPKGVPNQWLTQYPNIEKATFGCKRYYRAAGLGGYNGFVRSDKIKEVYFPNIESVEVRPYDNALIYQCSSLEVVECPNLHDVTSGYVNAAMFWGNHPNLKKLVLGKLTGNQVVFCGNSGAGSRPSLIHLEFGEGTQVSLSFTQYWNPTMALRTDTTAEDYVDLREDMSFANNLEQFLSNFKTYIAHRLTDKGSGLTLTLSQAVRDAIQTDPSIVSIITSKGWTISPAPSV